MTSQFPHHCGNRFLFDAAAVVQNAIVGLFGIDIDGHSSIRCPEEYYLKASTPNELAAVEVLNGPVEKCQSI